MDEVDEIPAQGSSSPSNHGNRLSVDMMSLCVKFPLELIQHLQQLSENDTESLRGVAQNDLPLSVKLSREEETISLQFTVTREQCVHFPWVYADNSLQFTLSSIHPDDPKPPEYQVCKPVMGNDSSPSASHKNKTWDRVGVIMSQGHNKNEQLDEEDYEDGTGLFDYDLPTPTKLDTNAECASPGKTSPKSPRNIVLSELNLQSIDRMTQDETKIQDYSMEDSTHDDNNTEISESMKSEEGVPFKAVGSENNEGNSASFGEDFKEMPKTRPTRGTRTRAQINCPVKESQKQKQKTLERYQHKCTMCPRKFLVQSSLKHHVSKKHHLFWETYCNGNKSTGCDVISNDPISEKEEPFNPLGFIQDGNSVSAENEMSYKENPTLISLNNVIETHSKVKGGRKTKAIARNCETKSDVKCVGCNAKFALYNNMYRHFIDVHKLDKTPEEYEKLLIIVETGRLAAAKRVSGYSIECPVCAMTFPGQRVLRHMKMAHLDHPDFAQLVESLHKQFVKLRNDNHAKNCTKPKELGTCPHCGFQATASVLGSHIRYKCTANKNRKDLFCCSKCGFMSVFKEKYEAHVQSAHTGTVAKKYMCDVCGNAYQTKGGFLQHRQRKHDKLNSLNKPASKHPCEICKKEFYTVTHLLRHMPVHTGVSPYKCDQCAKSYRDPSSLAVHRQSQHGSGHRFVCQHCGVGLDKKAALTKHLRQCPARLATTSEVNTNQNTDSENLQIIPMEDSAEGTLIQIPDLGVGEGQNILMVIQPDDFSQALLAEGDNVEQVMTLLMNQTNSPLVLDNNIIVQSSME